MNTLQKNTLGQVIRREIAAGKHPVLMTHIVLGYPSFEDNLKQLAAMDNAGIRLIELQIPFSEPSADGPTIAKACQESIDSGTRVSDCFAFAVEACRAYPQTAFLFMTYLNIVYQKGYAAFAAEAGAAGITGVIVPDLPPEHAVDWESECQRHGLSPVYIFSPTSTKERLQKVAASAVDMIYCMGRTGVTGTRTTFDRETEARLTIYREITDLPLGIGFGISSQDDIAFLRGKYDIAIIGSHLMKVYAESGESGLSRFLTDIQKT